MHPRLLQLHFILLAILLILSGCANIKPSLNSTASDKSQIRPPITVIADVHGDFPTMRKLLIAGNIIDHENNWIAGNRILVSLGDLVDRGPDSRQILDFFMQLEAQAQQAGGAFLIALGNHEVMNIRGDLRYVSYEEFAAFANDEPANTRSDVYKSFLIESNLEDSTENQAIFLERYPPGFFGHIQAYAPDGKYGQWLLSKSVILHLQNKLFAHGGFSEQLLATGKTITELNLQLMAELKEYSQLWRELIDLGIFEYHYSKREQLAAAKEYSKSEKSDPTIKQTFRKAQRFVKLANSLLFSRYGPTWYRGNMYCHEYAQENTLNDLLTHFDAEQIFLGHTPDESMQVRSRFGGKVIMLDTGMSKAYYAGNPSLVHINDDNLTVLNLNDSNNQSPTIDSVRKPLFADELSDEYLTKLFVKDSKNILKENNLLFKDKEKTIKASFISGVNAQHELSAFKIDRLLGLHLVPFTMEYQFQGKTGVVQYRLENTISKAELIDSQKPLRSFCNQQNSENLMQVFDFLIGNTRSLEDQVFNKDNAQLWLIQNHNAFTEQLDTDILNQIVISPSFKKAIQNLTVNNLTNAVGEQINRQQIKAVVKRKNFLLMENN